MSEERISVLFELQHEQYDWLGYKAPLCGAPQHGAICEQGTGQQVLLLEYDCGGCD